MQPVLFRLVDQVHLSRMTTDPTAPQPSAALAIGGRASSSIHPSILGGGVRRHLPARDRPGASRLLPLVGLFLLPLTLLVGQLNTDIIASAPAIAVATIAASTLLLGLWFQDPLAGFAGLLGLALFQNTLVGIGLSSPANGSILVLIELKTLGLYMLATLALGELLAVRRLKWALIFATLFIGWSVVRLSDGANVLTTLGYFRNFTAGFVAFFLGVAIGIKRRHTLRDLSWLLQLIAAILLVGLAIEILLGQSALWSAIGAPFLVDVRGGLPSNSDLFSLTLPRFASFIVDPINASYIGIATAVALVATARTVAIRKHVPAILAALLVGVLGWGKGGLFFGAVFLAFSATPKLGTLLAARPTLTLMGALVTAVAVMVGYAFLTSGSVDRLYQLIANPAAFQGGGNSVEYHLVGFASAIQLVPSNFFGNGLGVGGNLSTIAGNADTTGWLSTGAESGVAVLLAQLGVPGLVAFLGTWSACVRVASRVAPAAAYILTAWVACWVFQENVMGPQIALFITGIAGMLTGVSVDSNGDEVLRRSFQRPQIGLS